MSSQVSLAPPAFTTPPDFVVPTDACDAHAHVISSDVDTYPFIAERKYTPAPASEAAYLAMLARNRMGRGVLIQVSIYGSDNRLMLSMLKRHPATLRGVAVLRASEATDETLQDLHDAGVRGLRLNVLYGGGGGLDEMQSLAERIAGRGWHLQLLVDARDLPAMVPRIERLPVDVVLDHMGHMSVSGGVGQAPFRAMVALLEQGRAWVKLSGAYRLEPGAASPEVGDWARALVAAAPDRLVWGSDWPHVATRPMPDAGALLNLLARWVPDEATRRRILVDNPARLYGFA